MGVIPEGEIKFKAVRSRGPGGQNVNKVSSAAVLSWDFMLSSVLTDEQKNLIHEKLYPHVNKHSVLQIRSDEHRDLERNKARCLEKLESLLKQAFFKPKVRKKTRATAASKRRRVDKKIRRGELKKSRRAVDY